MFCKCSPLFLIWVPDEGETEADATRIEALDHVEAATEWAEAEDEDPDDPGCISDRGRRVVVLVKREGGHYVMRLVVGFETTPTFYARPAGPPSPEAEGA